MCYINKGEETKTAVSLKMPYYRSISGTSSGYDSSSDSDMDTLSEKDYTASSTMEPGCALTTALMEAHMQGRLTCGIYQAAKLLEMDPNGVMFCVVPVDAATDVALHIHLTLIEAFCWENDIRLIKVDCSEKLKSLICSLPQGDSNDNVHSSRDTEDDFSCILIEYPASGADISEADEELLYYHKHTCDLVPQPVLPLEIDTPKPPTTLTTAETATQALHP